MEAASLGEGLHGELHAAGLPMVMAEARQMRAPLSTMRNQTDSNDARGIIGWCH